MWRINVLGKMRTDEINLLNKIETKILTTYQESWLVSDALLAACFINPKVTKISRLSKTYSTKYYFLKVIKKSDNFHCTVELSGELTRGMMVVDKTFLKQKPSNATLILEIDESVFESMLVWAAGGQMYAN
jgi:inosine-uridine nucleoside N-ribohydrolase